MKESTRRVSLYKKWTKDVIERDKNICQWCHTPENLVAHHIKEWNEYPDLRFVLENGLTLCRSCHMSHHKNHKGKKQIPWNKGIKTGRGGTKKGTKFTEERKLKMRLQKLGKTTWNKGIPMKEETKSKHKKEETEKKIELMKTLLNKYQVFC